MDAEDDQDSDDSLPLLLETGDMDLITSSEVSPHLYDATKTDKSTDFFHEPQVPYIPLSGGFLLFILLGTLDYLCGGGWGRGGEGWRGVSSMLLFFSPNNISTQNLVVHTIYSKAFRSVVVVSTTY